MPGGPEPGRGQPQAGRRPQGAGAAAPCTIFSPEDLAIVSGGPEGPRDLLDDALALLDPEGARAADETDRVLRQRAALLRQSGGRPTRRRGHDARRVGPAPGRRRQGARGRAGAPGRRARAAGRPAAYGRLAGVPGDGRRSRQRYQRSWEGDLLDALAARARRRPAPRGQHGRARTATTSFSSLDGREARTHASQGEQRCLALALRLGVHELVRTTDALCPTLLLDDVFSELDPVRSRALVAELPAGQSILTTAAPLPEGIEVARSSPRSRRWVR